MGQPFASGEGVRGTDLSGVVVGEAGAQEDLDGVQDLVQDHEESLLGGVQVFYGGEPRACEEAVVTVSRVSLPVPEVAREPVVADLGEERGRGVLVIDM